MMPEGTGLAGCDVTLSQTQHTLPSWRGFLIWLIFLRYECCSHRSPGFVVLRIVSVYLSSDDGQHRLESGWFGFRCNLCNFLSACVCVFDSN